MQNIILSIVLLIIVSRGYSQEAEYNYMDANKLINVWLEAQKDYEDIPAIMGIAIKDQKIILSGSFGKSNIEKGIESDTQSVTNIGSVSKIFTATAIMKLIGEGKLKLEDKLKDVLP